MKKCNCPYFKSCNEFRQDLQCEIRERQKTSIEDCMFYILLKPMYEKMEGEKMEGEKMNYNYSNEKIENLERVRFIKEYYGEEAQANQILQELAELIIAITKEDLENTIEEIADVEIMISQFKIFEGVDLNIYKEFKKSITSEKIPSEIIEEELKKVIVRLMDNVITQNRFSAISNIAALENLIEKYIKLKFIDRQKIKKIKIKKIERQLKRIQDKERNKYIETIRKK